MGQKLNDRNEKSRPGAGTPKAAKAGTMQRIAFPAFSLSDLEVKINDCCQFLEAWA